jgi:hypothetical protein
LAVVLNPYGYPISVNFCDGHTAESCLHSPEAKYIGPFSEVLLNLSGGPHSVWGNQRFFAAYLEKPSDRVSNFEVHSDIQFKEAK